ncbi:splicing regulatory glutamine/lysine-rich protein 1 [Polyergus mexicanus]|uniref:splicing regulatory glutamine/lysine-rich protein 1 n=1 Tax=Polyergus mexicanus TaxID=615972 RepID=UPI0038B60B5F
MVRPSNPRLIARVLDAVMNLGDTRGSSAREVLSFILQSNVPPKNLTLQVHRALKHAVNAGLLRHRSGRYKALAILNPASVSTPSASKESTSDDKTTEENKSKSNVQAPIDKTESSSRRTEERKKRNTSRRRSSKHRSSKARRKSRRSPYPRRSNTSVQKRKRQQRKRRYEDEESVEDRSRVHRCTGRYSLHERDDEPSVPLNRQTKRSRLSKRELESDFSDESDRESDVNRKRVSRSSKPSCREPRRKETERAKSRGNSASRARSPQMLQRTVQPRQYSMEEVGNDGQRYDEDHGSTERGSAHQEAHEEEDVEGAREPNDSNSGSTLENSRD